MHEQPHATPRPLTTMAPGLPTDHPLRVLFLCTGNSARSQLAEVEGSIEVRQRAFDDTYRVLSRRIDLLLALPLHRLAMLAVARRVQAIGQQDAG